MRNTHATMSVDLGSYKVEGAYFPSDPGQYYGPPEHCWPGEPSYFEADTWTVGDTEVTDLIAHIDDKLFAFCKAHKIAPFCVWDLLEDEILTKIGELLAARDAEAAERYYDQMKEDELLGETYNMR